MVIRKLTFAAFLCLSVTVWTEAHCTEITVNNPKEYKIPNPKLSNNIFWEDDISDQAQTSSCTGHAVCECLKYFYEKSQVLPLGFHREAHQHFGTTGEIDKQGHKVEELMKFARDIKQYFKYICNISEFKLIGIDEIQRIKRALLIYRLPVVVAFKSTIGDDELFIENTWPLPDRLLNNNDVIPTSRVVSAHAVIVYGYSDRERGFLIKNSWGTNFLSQGKAVLGYDFFEKYSLKTSYIGWGESSSYFPIPLADMYYSGNGVDGNWHKALDLYEKLDQDHNDPRAQYMIGEIHRLGTQHFDRTKALPYYEKSSRQGYKDAKVRLANMYYFGNGVKKNWHKAFDLYQELARNYGDSRSKFMISTIYFLGRKDFRDPCFQNSSRWFKDFLITPFSHKS